MEKKRAEWLKEHEQQIVSNKYEKKIGKKHSEITYTARELEEIHGTYLFEQRMIDIVRSGNVSNIRSFLLDTVGKINLNEGTLADSPVRQAKNLFIGTVTLVEKLGAIPAGLPVEQAYYLTDTYIQECEKLESIEEVFALMFNMILDFTSRVSQHKLPEHITPEVHKCIQFIEANLNRPLSMADVVEFSHKSKSYITAIFKAETGATIGEYITISKIREAQSLLKYSNKSLSEISSYLGFSSQSYFQNIFKKYSGVTPYNYRRKNTV